MKKNSLFGLYENFSEVNNSLSEEINSSSEENNSSSEENNMLNGKNWNEIYSVQKKIGDSDIPIVFPPSGGWKAGPEFDPIYPTPTGSAGLGDDETEPSPKQDGWCCSVGDVLYSDGPNKGAVDPKKLDKGKKTYNDLRNGKGGKDINQILQTLSSKGSNYCNPNLKIEDVDASKYPQMFGKIGGEGKGYELDCRNQNGDRIPNCACDPICFPGVLGGYNRLDKRAVPDGPCIKGGILFNNVPVCTNDTPVQKCIDERKGEPIEGTDLNSPEGCPITPETIENKQCPKAAFPQVTDAVSDIANSMGMNQVCEKSHEITESHGSWGGAAVSMVGVGGVGGNFASTSTNNSSSGCGQRLANITRTSQNIQNIQCTISEAKAIAAARGKAIAKIDVTIAGATSDQLAQNEASIQAAYDQIDRISRVPNKFTDKLINSIMNHIAVLQNQFTSNISNSSFSAIANASINTVTKSDATTSSQIIAEQIDKISAEAGNQLATELGTGALDPNINQLVLNETSNNLANITSNISEALAQATAEGSAEAGVKVTLPAGASIDNSDFNATATLDLTASALAKSSSILASNISNSLLADAITNLDGSTDIKGMDDLVTAIGDAMAQNDPLKNLGDMFKGVFSGGLIWIVLIVGVIMVIGLIVAFMPDAEGESAVTKLAKTAADSQKPF